MPFLNKKINIPSRKGVLFIPASSIERLKRSASPSQPHDAGVPLVSPAPLSQQGAKTEHPRAACGLGPARRHLPDVSRDSASSSLTPGGKVAFKGDPQESQAGPLPRSTAGCLAFSVTIRLVPQSLLLQCGLAFPAVGRSHRSMRGGGGRGSEMR